MDRLQRIYKLHKILASRRLPVSRQELQEKLECSRATINRIIEEMRLYFNAPIEYSRAQNGYHYSNNPDEAFELPGLWFSADELYALLAVQQLLEQIQPGLLDDHLQPIKKRLHNILSASQLNSRQIAKYIRILRMNARTSPNQHFQLIANAVMQRKRLHIAYHSRTSNQQTQRQISPQRLAHYRDNWYLDAWCHKREALRSFALECIKKATPVAAVARDISEAKLDEHFATSYGIFAGKANHTAVLRFTAERARWVADEQWHPQQQGAFLPDGRYELHIPYANETELAMDILKHGSAVEVISPASLRQVIVKNLNEMQKIYTNEKK